MVLLFMVKEAREQLLKEGRVFTFRKKPHKTGRDWATDRRGGKKIADINIRLEKEVKTCADLKPYVEYSGFQLWSDWIRVIISRSKSKLVEGFLYEVTKI